MKDIIANITANVLTALYQPFWFSVALSVLDLFFYLFAYHNETGGRGLKAAFSVSETVFSYVLYDYDTVPYFAEP